MQVVEVFVDLDRYFSLVEMLQNKGIKFSEYKSVVYSKKDLDTEELLVLAPYHHCGYPQPDDDGGYIEYSYDEESACPKCSQGLIQDNLLRVNKLKMGKNQISALHWIYEFVVTLELKRHMENNNFSGCEFWPLIDHKKKTEYQGVFQLMVKGTMPPMSTKALIVPAKNVTACECGKKGFTLEGEAIYNRNTLKNIQDFK